MPDELGATELGVLEREDDTAIEDGATELGVLERDEEAGATELVLPPFWLIMLLRT